MPASLDLAGALLAALVIAAPPAASAQDSPCRDATWAHDLRARYPGEINRLHDLERRQQDAWSQRASAIGARVVAAGAATQAAHDAVQLAFTRSAPNVAADAQVQDASSKFLARNHLLDATLPIARVDPLRPDLAWCLLATSALEALGAKVDAEVQAWSLLDRELLDDAARRGVRIEP